MKTKLLNLASLLAAAAVSSTGAAQIAPGLSGRSTMQYFSGQEAWETLGVFGTCYAKQNPQSALELIATAPGSREEALTYKKLFRKPYQTCLGFVTELNVPYQMVRGAIAEGLYKRQIALPANLKLQAASVAEVRNLSDAARCYTATHADQAKALIGSTTVGSRQEFAAVTALLPDLAKCIPEGARAGNFNSTQIRFRLAEALLRTGASPLGAAGKN